MGRKACVENADGLDEHTQKKALFYVKQLTAAISPRQFCPSNSGKSFGRPLPATVPTLSRALKILGGVLLPGTANFECGRQTQSNIPLGENVAITRAKWWPVAKLRNHSVSAFNRTRF